MLIVETELDIKCDKCGNTLDAKFIPAVRRTAILQVTPCQTCLDDERNEGYSEGQLDAE